jgi:transcriptional regulator with XRE-family HTH domain
MAELAEKTGMESAYLEDIEVGKVNITIDECEIISNALRIDLEVLFLPPLELVPITKPGPATET